jgi:hypothetical protein
MPPKEPTMTMSDEEVATLVELHTTELLRELFNLIKTRPSIVHVAATSALALLSVETAKQGDPTWDDEMLEAAHELAAMLVARFTKGLPEAMEEARSKTVKS